ncbi:MAG TPA: ATP-binding protein [Anaerolinea sp.]|nr:ATP-binding protein [Anaerolinea sp.]
MSIAILIRGPLGVGKTTIARALSARLAGVYISIDAILEENQLDQCPDGIPARNFIRVNEIALPIAQAALSIGKPVVLDGNFYYKSQIKHLLKRLPKPSYVFTLNASVEECIARDRGRERVYGVDAATWVHFLVTRFTAGIPIDTSGKTAEQVVEEILRQLD